MSRAFHELVFDEFINGVQTNTIYTDPKWNELLASSDKLILGIVCDETSGTTPRLTVQIEHSADGRNWLNKSGTAEIPAVSPTPNSVQYCNFGADLGAVPSLGLVRLRLDLSGTAPVTHVRLYATGRNDP